MQMTASYLHRSHKKLAVGRVFMGEAEAAVQQLELGE
jgi:hypothetical protein